MNVDLSFILGKIMQKFLTFPTIGWNGFKAPIFPKGGVQLSSLHVMLKIFVNKVFKFV